MKITVYECARLLEGTEEWVRSLCKRGIIGDSWGNGKSRSTYFVVPTRLADYLKISESELEKRIRGVRRELEVEHY